VQELTLTISTSRQANEVKLVHSKDKTSSVSIKYFVDDSQQEWRLYKHITVREYTREGIFSSPEDQEAYPSVDLTLNVARRPKFYYWNAFFVTFLVTVCSLAAFSIKCHLNANRLQITCTLLLTLVSLRWTMGGRPLPPTVSYLTPLDKYAIMSMCLLVLECLWHAGVGSMMEGEEKCVASVYASFDFNAFVAFFCMHGLAQVVFIVWMARSAYTRRNELSRMELDYARQMLSKRTARLKSVFYGV
jgi:hypothetical protein